MGLFKSLFTGALLGAGAMYLFDPRMGNRRRAEIEGRLAHLSRRAARGVDSGLRDLTNRAKGVPHKLLWLVRSADGHSGRSRRNEWSPGPRLVAATVGTLLMTNCSLRRTPRAMILGTAGFGLFVRAVSNKPLETALGLSNREYAVDIEKSIEIGSPVERVFDFFNNPENYERISDVVTSVEVAGEGFAKEMMIAGVPLRFEEQFVCRNPGHGLKTVSAPRSAMRFMKQLRFQSLGDQRTRVHLSFSYTPPLGVVGHSVAVIFGCDAKSVLTELLMRAKFFLETGREPHDAAGRNRTLKQPEVQEPQPAAGPERGERHAHSSRESCGSCNTQPETPRSSSSAQVGWKLPHGSGAPIDDIARPGFGIEPMPLRPADDPLPEPSPAGGQFPPAV